MRKIDYVMPSNVVTNDRVVDTSREVTIESPQLGFATLGGSFALTPNQTRVCFVAPSGSDEMDRSGMLVAFTLDSVSPAEHELRTGDRTLKVLDLAGNTTMGCTFPQRSVLNSASNVIHPEGDEFRSVAAFGIASTSATTQQALEHVMSGIDGVSESGDWIECVNGFVFLMGEHANEVAGALEQTLAIRDGGSCRGVLESGTKQTTRVPLFDVPLGQTPSIAYSGFSETILSQVYTDVATASSSTHNVAAALSTGRFWRLEGAAQPVVKPVSIRLDQRLRRGDPAVLAEKVGSSARLERVDFDRNSFADELATGQDSATYPRAYSLLEGTGATAVLTAGNIVIERRTGR